MNNIIFLLFNHNSCSSIFNYIGPEIIDKLKKKDFKHAMAIATTMENRANTHAHQTPEMRDAAKILRKWIDANKRS